MTNEKELHTGSREGLRNHPLREAKVEKLCQGAAWAPLETPLFRC